MSREIKFKVWDKKNKEMVKLYQLHFDNDQVDVINKDGLLYPILNKKDYVLIQYIDLSDKNSKEIYCEDILLDPINNEKYIIQWQELEARFIAKTINHYGIRHIPDVEIMEIIGNRFENPNLLK